MKRSVVLLMILGWYATSAFGQDEGPGFHVEFTSTFWFLSPTGTIKAGTAGTLLDLKSGLGVVDRRLNDLMRVNLKLGDTHRVVVEGGSYRFSGTQDVSVPFKFSGTDFTLGDTVFSKPTIHYVFGWYGRDLFSRDLDHLGIRAGLAYLHGKGSVESLRTGISAEQSRGVPLPIVGLEYGRNLTGIADRFEISADISGMGIGDTGHYVRGIGQVGARVWRFIVVHGGYGVLDMQASRGQDSFDVRYRGPVITVEFRDR